MSIITLVFYIFFGDEPYVFLVLQFILRCSEFGIALTLTTFLRVKKPSTTPNDTKEDEKKSTESFTNEMEEIISKSEKDSNSNEEELNNSSETCE